MCVRIHHPSFNFLPRDIKEPEYMITIGRHAFSVNYNSLYWLRNQTFRYKRTCDELWNERCLMIGPLLLSWIHYKQPLDMRV